MSAEKILVADDEEALREVIGNLLEAAGYRWFAVPSGREAAIEVTRNNYDLVLSDLLMPGMDGLKLLEHVRSHDPDIPVILVTAMHDLSVALKAMRNGAYDYILKPFEKEQLYLSVRRALEHRRLVKENNHYQRALELMVEEKTQQLVTTLNDLEQSYDYTLEALGGALDARDAETEGHCQRVTAVTIIMPYVWSLAAISDIPVSVRCPRPHEVVLEPEGRPLKFDYEGTTVHFIIPEVRIYEVVRIKWE